MPLQSKTLLETLLNRGDHVSIQNSELIITPKSGKPIPPEWLNEHRQEIINDCLCSTGTPYFRYIGYSTGRYGEGKYKGVTLQFINIMTGEEVFACFNALLDRQRTTKHSRKGEPLPNGEFRVKPKSAFKQFWSNTGLPVPPRFYDRMGNLSKLLYQAEHKEGNKLINSTITPINISHESLILTTNSRLTHDQATTKGRLSPTTKETEQSQAHQGIQEDSSTGNFSTVKGNKVVRVKGNVISLSNTVLPDNQIDPQKQPNDEWLAEFSGE